jgi:hypothetical protein
MATKISEEYLKKGNEVDITSQGNASRNFRISIRYNEVFRRFEVFRHYYRTKKNEVEYHSKNLKDIIEYIKSMYGVEFETD